MRLALQRQGGKLNHAAELLRRSDHAFRIFERAAFFFDDAAAGPQTGPQRTEPGIIPSEPPGFLNRVHRFNSCRGHAVFGGDLQAFHIHGSQDTSPQENAKS